MELQVKIDNLTRQALKRCEAKNVAFPRSLMRYLIQWMYTVRSVDLAKAENNAEKIDAIHEWIYARVMEHDPVMQMLRLRHYFHNTLNQFDQVQVKYEKTTRDKLVPLIEAICNINGRTKKDQDELFKKIVIYLVASNKLFSTKNTHMMNEAKCALQSILSPEDLLDFVSRNKLYRLSFMERMGKIMCGILLYNKQAKIGGEAIRDVVSDVMLGYKNTVASLENQLSKCNDKVKSGLAAVSHSVKLNLKTQHKVYRIPEQLTVEDFEYFNQFNYLHLLYQSYLEKLLTSVNNLSERIEQYSNEMKETFFKLNEVIKFRLAIPTELVFPNFVSLFHTWYKILMQLYYLVEINRISEDMATIVSLNYPFEAMASKLVGYKNLKTVEIPIGIELKPGSQVQLSKDAPGCTCLLKKFCGLTIALTEGLLVHSEPTIGFLPVQDHYIAFKQKSYALFAQVNHTELAEAFTKIARRHPEICVLFEINVSPAEKLDRKAIQKQLGIAHKLLSVGNQTEHCVPPCTREERLTYSWNCWDYRRRAILLANLKRCQTHSSQTDITYSSKDATVQTYQLRSR